MRLQAHVRLINVKEIRIKIDKKYFKDKLESLKVPNYPEKKKPLELILAQK